jgi:hypothetical protein
MYKRKSAQFMGAFLAVAVFAACNGGNQVVPAGQTFGSTPQGQSVVNALSRAYPELAQRLAPMAANPLTCNVPDAHVPGKFVTMFALGTVQGTTFTVPAGGGVWIYQKYVKGTPPPTPGTTPTPKNTPTPIASGLPPNEKFIFYTGSFTLKSHGQGCMFLLTTPHGGPIVKGEGKSNGEALGEPTFTGNVNPVDKPVLGALNLSIGGLNANGGKGNAVLVPSSGKGPAFDTGTVTLTSRVEITI